MIISPVDLGYKNNDWPCKKFCGWSIIHLRGFKIAKFKEVEEADRVRSFGHLIILDFALSHEIEKSLGVKNWNKQKC